jgi:glyoxylase-like metal-dependent hydrolase (beta-lactamase superfamily II)
MELLDGIYFYPWESATENNCNTIFIDGDLPTLIDPGHAHLLPGLLDAMEEDGVSPDGVKLVINTHGHPDHCEGSEWFRERGAMVTISEEEDEFLRGPLGDIYEAMGMEVSTAEPDFFLKEGSLNFGSRDAEILITPGHTPASACIYLADEKVLIVGDLVFLGGVGRVDLPGGNPTMLKESIARISGLEVAHILPGHGQVISGEENVEANFQFIRQAILQMI